jgi:hypothetical protein
LSDTGLWRGLSSSSIDASTYSELHRLAHARLRDGGGATPALTMFKRG